MPSAELISITPNHLDVLKTACSMPYGKGIGNKTLQKIIQAGHLSVLEHCYATFKIKCSVRVLGQLTRHRHLSFTCKSARGSSFSKFVDPKTFETLNSGQTCALDNYNVMLGSDMELEQIAYYLPQGIETEIVVTGNFRAWLEYLPKRLCQRAMPEHRKLAEDIAVILHSNAPLVFPENMKNCANCKEWSCKFK